MRTRNPSTGRAEAVVRGHIGSYRAGSSGITVSDGTTDVDGVMQATFRGASVSDIGEGVAEITITGTGQLVTNGEATSLSVGEVVVLDAATNTVIYTTTAQDTRPVGVVQRSTLTGEAGPVVFSGFVTTVLTTASVTAGDYLETSTTAGQAQTSATRRTGSFGIVLDPGGANPPAMLFNSPDTTGSGAGGAFELNTEGGQSVIKAHGSMGATETFDPTDGNIHTGTLNANCTFTLNAPTGTGAATLELYLTNDTGARTVTWPVSVAWPGAITPTLGSGGAASVDRIILETLDGGTTWYGVQVGGGASFATPAIVLGSSAAAGSATTVIRSDATIVAFDATSPTTQAFGDAAVVGTAAFAARRDHLHAMPSVSATAAHAHVASETHLANGSTVTWTLDQNFEPGSVIAWNTTTLARLGVTEIAPDQATVSAAGTTGDSIVFDYAATIV